MATTPEMRTWWRNYRCFAHIQSLAKPISMMGLNAGVCAIPAYAPLKAAEQALVNTGYVNVKSIWVPRKCPLGIAGKPCQTDGTNCSLHNYGVAFDIDPFKFGNPHFYKKYGNGWDFSDCKITEEQVRAVEAIKNTYGEQMFRWLGWLIGDTMHFELQVPPNRCKVDWSTVPGDFTGEDEEMSLKKGSKGNAVGYYQEALNGWKDGTVTVDKIYGDKTVAGVKAYQAAAELDQTGVIDGVTADLLGRYHPDRGGDGKIAEHKHEIGGVVE